MAILRISLGGCHMTSQGSINKNMALESGWWFQTFLFQSYGNKTSTWLMVVDEYAVKFGS